MRSSFRKFISAAALCIAAVAPALGQGINIDFEPGPAGGPGGGLPNASFGAAAAQPGQWNRVFNTPNPIALNGLDGLASGVTMQRSSPISHSGFDNPSTTGDYQFLLDDFWNIDNGPATAEFFGLNPGWYEVYTYAITPNASQCRNSIEVVGAETPTVQVAGGVMPFNNFLLGRTHTRHRVFIPNENTSLKINISNFSGACIAVGGIQIKEVAPCPVVDITEPANFACICEDVEVKGDVTISAPGIIAFWYTEWRGLNDLNWNFIDFGFSAGVSMPLGNFSTAGLAEGYYFIKTTAFSGDGCFDEDTHIVYVDKSFETVDITTPVAGQAYGSTVCVGGLVNDRCLDRYIVQWAPLPAGAPFTDVNPLMPQYFGQIYNAVTFATWDTIGQNIPDGEYRIRVDARDICGHTGFDTVDMIVDNTDPDGVITSPTNCEYVGCGLVTIKGTACDTNLAGWVVQVTGGPYNNWVTIASGNTCVIDDVLAVWDTTGLPLCGYTIRLIVSDSSIQNCNGAIVNQTEFQVSVNVGLRGDVDGDGDVDFTDIANVLVNFGAMCP